VNYGWQQQEAKLRLSSKGTKASTGTSVNYGWQQQEAKLRLSSKGTKASTGTSVNYGRQQQEAKLRLSSKGTEAGKGKRNTDNKDKDNTQNAGQLRDKTRLQDRTTRVAIKQKLHRQRKSRETRQRNLKARPEGTTG
jgi:predicted DsbA family dithiol-disulfide isomerase